jgi:SAM domain (Sterile alpha motif)/Tetratricopeptide repeat
VCVWETNQLNWCGLRRCIVKQGRHAYSLTENDPLTSITLYREAIASEGVMTREDALEFWIRGYTNQSTVASLIRDVWLIVAEYSISRIALREKSKELIASWYYHLGIAIGNLKDEGNTGSVKKNRLELFLFSRAFEIKPDAKSLEARASVYLEQGKFDLAIDYFHAALRLNRKSVSCLDGLGMAYYDSGKMALAHRSYIEALAAFEAYGGEDVDPTQHEEGWKRYLLGEIANSSKKISKSANSATNRPNPNVNIDLGAMSEWSVQDVGKWLVSIAPDYRVYAARFASNGLNGRSVLKLTDELLLKLGITNQFHRIRMVTDIDHAARAAVSPMSVPHCQRHSRERSPDSRQRSSKSSGRNRSNSPQQRFRARSRSRSRHRTTSTL